MRWALISLLLCAAVPAAAQNPAHKGGGDTRIQNVEYGASALVQVRTAPASSQTVLFAKGERIRSINLSVPDSYQIDLSSSGDGFTLRPNGAGSLSILSVKTDARSYELELVPGGASAAPAIIQFTYGRPTAQPPLPGLQVAEQEDAWKKTGDKTLWPSSIRDDGRKTYIAWEQDQAMPAVFAIGPGGKEEMVEGYVRAGAFTIDRVYDRLTFRIDRRKAQARRLVDRERGRP